MSVLLSLIMGRILTVSVFLVVSCGTPLTEVHPEVLCNGKCASLRACYADWDCGEACGTVHFIEPVTHVKDCTETCLSNLSTDPQAVDMHRNLAKSCRGVHSCEYISCLGDLGESIDCGLAGIEGAESVVWSPLNIDYCGSF